MIYDLRIMNEKKNLKIRKFKNWVSPMGHRGGFSLFELLVVISIIGILIGVGAVAYSSSQKKARDSRAKSEIDAISKAFEQYYVDNDGYGTCAAMGADSWQGVWPPQDPRGNSSGDADYMYNFDCDDANETYCICADLAESSGGNASDTSCTWASDGGYYCRENQQ